MQAQYDRVIEQERAIDAVAEQSLSRKTSAQPKTLIRAHRSGALMLIMALDASCPLLSSFRQIRHNVAKSGSPAQGLAHVTGIWKLKPYQQDKVATQDRSL